MRFNFALLAVILFATGISTLWLQGNALKEAEREEEPVADQLKEENW
jgi:hypothetical protein